MSTKLPEKPAVEDEPLPEPKLSKKYDDFFLIIDRLVEKKLKADEAANLAFRVWEVGGLRGDS